MKSVLFVCLGNICRSPAAHGVFKALIEKANLGGSIQVDSAGTNGFHNGELPDPRMRKHAEKRGYHLDHRSRQITAKDFDRFDYILVMDDSNLQTVRALLPPGKVHSAIFKLTDFSIDPMISPMISGVPDPYYGGGESFELVLDLVENSCQGLLKFLTSR